MNGHPPQEEKTKAGRVFAYSYMYNGAAVTATKLYFDDGDIVTIAGHLHFPALITVEVTYVEHPKKPSELKVINILAGG